MAARVRLTKADNPPKRGSPLAVNVACFTFPDLTGTSKTFEGGCGFACGRTARAAEVASSLLANYWHGLCLELQFAASC